jgi:hypothetical protein
MSFNAPVPRRQRTAGLVVSVVLAVLFAAGMVVTLFSTSFGAALPSALAAVFMSAIAVWLFRSPSAPD